MATENDLTEFILFLQKTNPELFQVFNGGLGLLKDESKNTWDLAISTGRDWYTDGQRADLIALWNDFITRKYPQP